MDSDVLIRAENLSFSYHDGTRALENISFELKSGDKIGLLGPNGAGKSTLIRLLNGTLEGQGKIYFKNTELNRKHIKQLHKHVGVVFQNPDDQLFCPTIYEDVAFGPVNLQLPEAEIKKRVKSALGEVGLEGYEHRSSFHLSYGERKSASIATIISMNPDVYIFDEPSSNLDPYHRRKIIKFIQKLKKTILIATHDLDLVLDTCDKIIIVNKGKLVTTGGLEMLKNEKLLSANNLELPMRYQQG